MGAVLDLLGLGGVPSTLIEIGLVIAVLTGGWFAFAHHERGVELAHLQKTSIALVARVKELNAASDAAVAAAQKANQEKLDEANARNAATAAQLDQRVRDFDAYRRTHPDVARPAPGGGTGEGGECGTLRCGDLVALLADRGNMLAGVAGQLSGALRACQADRDSVTGLPLP